MKCQKEAKMLLDFMCEEKEAKMVLDFMCEESLVLVARTEESVMINKILGLLNDIFSFREY